MSINEKVIFFTSVIGNEVAKYLPNKLFHAKKDVFYITIQHAWQI